MPEDFPLNALLIVQKSQIQIIFVTKIINSVCNIDLNTMTFPWIGTELYHGYLPDYKRCLVHGAGFRLGKVQLKHNVLQIRGGISKENGKANRKS